MNKKTKKKQHTIDMVKVGCGLCGQHSWWWVLRWPCWQMQKQETIGPNDVFVIWAVINWGCGSIVGGGC